jgi:hypothetical protein
LKACTVASGRAMLVPMVVVPRSSVMMSLLFVAVYTQST